MAFMQNFFYLIRDENDGDSAGGQSINNLENAFLSSDIDANRRGVKDQYPRVGRKPFGEYDPLLIAARQLLDRPIEGLGFSHVTPRSND